MHFACEQLNVSIEGLRKKMKRKKTGTRMALNSIIKKSSRINLSGKAMVHTVSDTVLRRIRRLEENAPP
jgi:hypothetical protein